MRTEQKYMCALYVAMAGVVMCLSITTFMVSPAKTVYCPPPRKKQALSSVKRPVTICQANRQVVASTRYAFASMISVTHEVSDWRISRYVEGAVKLGSSIQQTWGREEAVDMILLVFLDDGLSDEPVRRHRWRLSAAGWQICPVPALWSGLMHDSSSGFHRAKLYSKIHVWRLKEYDAVAILDADTLALQDTSGLFWSVLPQMRAGGFEFAAAPDRPTPADVAQLVWYSSLCYLVGDQFNAGVMLLVPSAQVYRDLRLGIDTIPHETRWCEQGLLNAYFRNRTYPLPERYNTNLVLRDCAPEKFKLNETCILHFTVAKPWMTILQDGWLRLACWMRNAQAECKRWHQQCEVRPVMVSA